APTPAGGSGSACAAGPATWPRSRRRRWRSTCAVSPTRRPSTPPARTTGPGRPWTTASTPRTWGGAGSAARCWPCGARAGSPAGPGTRWPAGGRGAATCGATGCLAATSCPRRRRRRPWTPWPGSSGAEQDLEPGPGLVLGLGPLVIGVGPGHDPGPGEQVAPGAVQGGAAEGDRPLAVAGAVDPADRAGVAAAGERVQGGRGGAAGVP